MDADKKEVSCTDPVPIVPSSEGIGTSVSEIFPILEHPLAERIDELEKRKNRLRLSHQSTLSHLNGLRTRLRDICRDARLVHDLQQHQLASGIRWLERELGSSKHVENCHFSMQEIEDLQTYVNNNPYLRSLLHQRNARLLQTLLDYPQAPSQDSQPGNPVALPAYASSSFNT